MAGLSVASLGVSYFSFQAKQEVYWALLSDTHTPEDIQNEYRGFYPYKNLKKVVPEIVATRPTGVVINGDVARLTGEVGDYKNVKELLTPLAQQSPIYMTMGNHDDREHFHSVFDEAKAKEKTVKDKHVVVVKAPPVRMVLLDSLLFVNKTPGLLGKEQRTWLENFLIQSDSTPTLLFVHHTLGDKDTDLLDVERMFEIIKPHQKVKAVFYGHSHEYKYDKLDGIHLVNQPAVGYNFSDNEPVGWIEAKFSKEGAALTLKAFGGNRHQHNKTTTIDWR